MGIGECAKDLVGEFECIYLWDGVEWEWRNAGDMAGSEFDRF